MRLAAIGSNCIDYYENVGGGTAVPGGGPVNMAVYAVRTGESASYFGPVGNDEYGKILIDAVKEKGVDVSHVRVLDGHTALSHVEMKDNERVFGDYEEGVMEQFSLSEEELDFIARNYDVCVSDLWGRAEGYFGTLQKRGVLTAFDGAVRPGDEAALKAARHSDCFFFSSDDGETETLHELMKVLRSLGAKIVVAMLGSEGSLAYDGETWYRYGIVPCDPIVDTMGAGDSYITGFLQGMSRSLPVEECMRLGAENASRTLRYFGAW